MSTEDPPRLLVVEDEAHIATGLKLNFELEGYAVDLAATGREAGRLLLESPPYDVIVLDVMLPDVDGLSLCQGLREAGNLTPVLMLTARDRLGDRVDGIQAGADDYLTKPFELSELLARVRSLIRRSRWEQERRESSLDSQGPTRFGRVEIFFDAQEACVDGNPLQLTTLEFDLLRYFTDHPGRVLSRRELQREVWKLKDNPNQRMVDNFVMRLRKHFEPEPSEPVFFLSVRGAGYKFDPAGGQGREP